MTINEMKEQLATLDGDLEVYVADKDTGDYLAVIEIAPYTLKNGRIIGVVDSVGYDEVLYDRRSATS